MEKKLTKLFDFQRFMGNERLAAMLDGLDNGVRELSDDDVDMVFAAGDASQMKKQIKQPIKMPDCKDDN